MIKVLLKRIVNFMPYVAAYFLALGLAAMAFAFFGENVLFKDGSFSMVKVACYLPSDNELNSAGFSFISNMNSVEDTISFVELDSPEEVRTAVDEGDVVAGLIIPENFASGIFSGSNPELEVVFKSADTFDEQVVKDIERGKIGVLHAFAESPADDEVGLRNVHLLHCAARLRLQGVHADFRPDLRIDFTAGQG